ncbi:hypothetical protein [Mesorhizobium sp. M4B.F.Ca.ET.143.01.1.1]|uniref:hypothetical protein n=1 Tax=Mesorhizobium sp. TaxID=1871066 RepID=UPI001677AC1D
MARTDGALLRHTRTAETNNRWLCNVGFERILPPKPITSSALQTVHDPGFIQFLEAALDRWSAEGRQGDALPSAWATRTSCHLTIPQTIDGQLAYYAADAAAPIGEGTFRAALASAASALDAENQVLDGIEPIAFALCRPPGHHAGRDSYGATVMSIMQHLLPSGRLTQAAIVLPSRH